MKRNIKHLDIFEIDACPNEVLYDALEMGYTPFVHRKQGLHTVMKFVDSDGYIFSIIATKPDRPHPHPKPYLVKT